MTWQVINRAKLERAGKDNLFVKTLYGKDEAIVPQSIEQTQRIGEAQYYHAQEVQTHERG